MSDDPKRGTVDGLLSFTGFLVDKNYAARSAIKPWEAAINQVFYSVFKDEYLVVDVLEIDLDDLMRRFANATGTKYKPESRKTYRARLARAINLYREHLNNPDEPPNIEVRARGPRSVPANSGHTTQNGSGGSTPSLHQAGSSSEIRSYSLPLRNGDATLTLPREFYKEDAERLSKLIETLVFEPMRQISAQTDAAGGHPSS